MIDELSEERVAYYCLKEAATVSARCQTVLPEKQFVID